MVSSQRPHEAIVVAGNPEWIDVEHVQNGWLVWARFRMEGGAPSIEALRLSAVDDAPPPPGGVTTNVLRAVRTGPLFDALGKDDGSGSRFTMVLNGVDPDQNFLNVRRPGRRGRDDLPYAVWAARYVTKVQTNPRAPYPELAAEHPGFSERTIRECVSKARNRDLLTRVGQGRTGGELTAKAKALLAETRER